MKFDDKYQQWRWDSLCSSVVSNCFRERFDFLWEAGIKLAVNEKGFNPKSPAATWYAQGYVEGYIEVMFSRIQPGLKKHH